MSDSIPTGERSEPKQVSRFEANVLRIVRYFFHQTPEEQAMKLVKERMIRPPCLSADAVHLVRDTLSKGCILYLARAGGWRRSQFLREGIPQFGRLWERTKLEDLTLSFSAAALEFLIGLAAGKIPEDRGIGAMPIGESTIGDRLLLFLAYEGLRVDAAIGAELRTWPVFMGHPLCRLAYPGDFAHETPIEVPTFQSWLSGSGSYVLEAMQATLENRWLEIERGKGQLGDWRRMRLEGSAQHQVLDRFLTEADRANRPDLARFLLSALGRILSTPNMAPTFWTGGLQGNGPPRLADRLETQRSAMALLRHADRFRQWQQRARTRGYFDEDYAAGKFWLGQWEALDGERIVRRAEQVVQMLEPLRPTT